MNIIRHNDAAKKVIPVTVKVTQGRIHEPGIRMIRKGATSRPLVEPSFDSGRKQFRVFLKLFLGVWLRVVALPLFPILAKLIHLYFGKRIGEPIGHKIRRSFLSPMGEIAVVNLDRFVWIQSGKIWRWFTKTARHRSHEGNYSVDKGLRTRRGAFGKAGPMRRVRRPLSTFKARPNRVNSPAIPCWFAVLTGLVFASSSSFGNETTPTLPEKHFDFLSTYCLDCHDSLTEKGSVNLEDLAFQITTIQEAELWQKVLNTMNSGEMPPDDKKQPSESEKADFLDALAQTMVDARRSLSDTGGEITMRRLNRREYQNSIEYLTGVRVDAGTLPADGGGNTFDTEGASQFISSDQIEQYLKLGRSAIGELFERQAAVGRETMTFRVEPENTVNVASREAMAVQEETYERYLKWKAEVDKVAFLPENEEALKQIREKYGIEDLKNNLRLYQNANLLKGAPDATKFGFRDGNQASFSYQGGYSRTYAYKKQYLEFPNSNRGTYLKLAWAIQRIDILPDPKDIPPGTYQLRIRAGAVEGSDASRHFIEIGHPQRVNQVPAGFAGKPLASVQVTGTEENPEIIETTLTIGSKTPREFGIQERRPEGNQKALSREFYAHKRENGYGTPPAIWVDWIELVGPIPDNEAVESRITRIEPEKTINPANEKEIATIEDAYARSAEWQKGVDEAVKTPANQAKIAEIRKTEPKINHPQWFYAFADRLEGTPDATDFGFRDSQKAAASDPKGDRANLAYHKHYASLPHRDRGTYLKLAHGTGRVIISHKEKQLPPGSYTLRVAAASVEGSPASRHFIEVGHPQRLIESRNWGLEGQPISSHQVNGTFENPQVIEIPLEVGTDTIREFAIQEKQPNTGNLKELWDAHNAWKKKNGYGHPPAIWIDWVELEGPHPDKSTTWTQRREVEDHAKAKVGGTYNGYFKGGHEKAQTFLKTGEEQGGVTDEQEARFRIRTFEENGPGYRRYLENPLTQSGSLLTLSNVNKEEFIALPPTQPSGWKETKHVVETLPPGDYHLRFRIGAIEGTPEDRHFVDLGEAPDKDQFKHLATFQVTGTTEAPQTITFPVTLTKDSPRRFALREKRDPKTDHALVRATRKETGTDPEPALWIDWVEWEGPLTATSDDSTFTDWWVEPQAAPDESDRARQILENFAVTAFRDVPAEDDFLDRLVNIYETRRNAGKSFEDAIELPLGIILASPGFLYLNEPSDASPATSREGSPHPPQSPGENIKRTLTDRELAVRLAYFLWSAPPDKELLSLAQKGELGNPDILRSQVDRLIADPRSDEFVAGFLHQWLDMERLDFFQFDTTLYRDFDESTRSAARQEVYESFAHLLRSDDGNLGQLLKSDHVFVNGLLATYYGLEGVTGDQFQKVSLPAGSPRGGLLGMAAVHAMGSDGIESSPVERGAWVLRHLLNDPPPPAPPNVPQLSRLLDQPLTTREKLAAHMEEAQCASCHRKIDPIGFGLENFNAAGKWRTEEGKGKSAHEIDPSGAFHNGPEFADYFEMRDLISDREPDFARGFTEHLIGYALGRPFGFTDEDLADEIVAAAKEEDYSVSEIVQALVASEAFGRK